MNELRAFLTFCGITASLLLLALFFKGLGGGKTGGYIVMGLMLLAACGIIGMICRQGK